MIVYTWLSGTIQFSSVSQSCPTLCNPIDCSIPGFLVYHQLPELAQTYVHQVSDAIQLSHPLLSSSLPPSIFPSIGVFSIESVIPSNHLILCHPFLLLPSIFHSIGVISNELALCIRWPKYWSFSFNISPSKVHSGLISFRMDWLDLLVVQGLSRVFSNTTVQKHQFFSTQLSL